MAISYAELKEASTSAQNDATGKWFSVPRDNINHYMTSRWFWSLAGSAFMVFCTVLSSALASRIIQLFLSTYAFWWTHVNHGDACLTYTACCLTCFSLVGVIFWTLGYRRVSLVQIIFSWCLLVVLVPFAWWKAGSLTLPLAGLRVGSLTLCMCAACCAKAITFGLGFGLPISLHQFIYVPLGEAAYFGLGKDSYLQRVGLSVLPCVHLFVAQLVHATGAFLYLVIFPDLAKHVPQFVYLTVSVLLPFVLRPVMATAVKRMASSIQLDDSVRFPAQAMAVLMVEFGAKQSIYTIGEPLPIIAGLFGQTVLELMVVYMIPTVEHLKLYLVQVMLSMVARLKRGRSVTAATNTQDVEHGNQHYRRSNAGLEEHYRRSNAGLGEPTLPRCPDSTEEVEEKTEAPKSAEEADAVLQKRLTTDITNRMEYLAHTGVVATAILFDKHDTLNYAVLLCWPIGVAFELISDVFGAWLASDHDNRFMVVTWDWGLALTTFLYAMEMTLLCVLRSAHAGISSSSQVGHLPHFWPFEPPAFEAAAP